MRDAPDPHPELDAVTSLLRKAASEQVDAVVHAEGRRRLVEAAEAARLRRRSRRGASFAGVALAAAALGGLFIVYRARQPALTYQVQNSSSSVTSYVSAGVSDPATVRFSDGSDIVAEPDTRLRVEETHKDGARVLLERGSATARVTHREHSSWLFVAGPFDVHVTGTKLTLAWDPEKEEVDVTLHEGSVEIDSPIGPSHYSVRAGHRLHASVRDGLVRMEDVSHPTARAATPASPPANTVEAPARPARVPDSAAVVVHDAHDVRSASSNPAPAPAPREESWSDLVRHGAFGDVVAAARDRGVEGCLESCSLLDLRALGDAARYSGDADLAKRSFLSIRSRFAGTHQSAAAAFLLGRTVESSDVSAADRWYRTYLSEAPNGEFASDALAGRMRTTTALAGPAAGASVAEEYLRKYPDGVHSAAARKLIRPN